MESTWSAAVCNVKTFFLHQVVVQWSLIRITEIQASTSTYLSISEHPMKIRMAKKKSSSGDQEKATASLSSRVVQRREVRSFKKKIDGALPSNSTEVARKFSPALASLKFMAKTKETSPRFEEGSDKVFRDDEHWRVCNAPPVSNPLIKVLSLTDILKLK